MNALNGILHKLWKDKDEEKIHNCLIEAFENNGYEVEHIHKRRSRSEKGIDIKCKRNDETLIFQAKMKPGRGDRGQLKVFSKQKASKRVYVYINEPTTDFKDTIKK